MAAQTTGVLLTTDRSGYDDALKRLLAGPAPHYVVFSANLDDSGQPWCPDCVRSLPAIKRAVQAVNGSLLEVQVGGRPEWKSPDHPYRHDPLKLQGIPTLAYVAPDGSLGRRICSELEEAPTAYRAAVVAEAFVTQTSAKPAAS